MIAIQRASAKPMRLKYFGTNVTQQDIWTSAISFILLATMMQQTGSAAQPGASAAETNSRPNVLLILADDLGYSDLGCYGSEIATPHLDAVAAKGLRFTQFYNTARCWPTRGSLMTGYYAQQIRRDSLPGVPSGNGGKRPDWAVLLPTMLRPAGYRSYHTGKWHIDSTPIASGFDRSYYLKDQGRFFNPTKHWKDDVPLPPVAKGTEFYATTALADHAIEVLQEHQRDHDDKPFFQYLAFAAPHFPLHALPQDIAVYQDTYVAGWDVARANRWQRIKQLGLVGDSTQGQLSRIETDLGPPYHFPDVLPIVGEGEVDKPLAWKALSPQQQTFQAAKMSIHAAMIHRMDIEIGRVFDQIKAMDRWDDTIVVFLSDNGASAEMMVRDDGHDPGLPAGSAGTYLCLGPGWSTVANTPFRRHKTWTHEGGISTPLIMSWPNGISAAGQLRHTPGHVIDLVPTLLDLTGGKHADDAPTLPGKSLTNILSDDVLSDDTGNRAESLWWFHDGHRAIRIGDWKAVSPIGEPWELYNVAVDRDESTDLAIPAADKLHDLIAAWQSKTDEFTELATRDLDAKSLQKAKRFQGRSGKMGKAQADAKPKRKQNLLQADTFLLNDRHAFVMQPKSDGSAKSQTPKPWIFYGPTLNRYPDNAERWMHQKFLDAGVAIAGIDVGEAYGSPHALPFFDALYDEMVRRGYSKTPALLGRSRGGLWVSSWAISHPDRVAGIGGIYPVYDYTTYPGVARAAVAYGETAADLQSKQATLNPIKRIGVLVDAKIPVCIIHGTDDKVVPIEANSMALQSAYAAAGQADLVQLIQSQGQGHSFWEGFFHCQELVDFLIQRAKNQEQP
ncbi:sulfatase-like hydrolase/transferase [Planctomycetes bacterium K23_9]|uniref:Arylsulfatase n=1 Tax=Stieleria marina TaxID=1930275 RepID=A0A517NWM4_9BACT|nr:Arylsulfatase [Planctomycetes bacterium K23_9]